TVTPAATTPRGPWRRSRNISSWDTRRCGPSPACRGWRRPTAAAGATSTTSRRSRGCRPRPCGAPNATPASGPRCSPRCARGAGPDAHLPHGAHPRLRRMEAAGLGKGREPYLLFWLEDPVPAEMQEGFRLIRKHTTTPLAVGEVFNTIYDAEQLLKEQLVDYM